MGSSLLYISIAYYMQKGGGWVQIACQIAYVLNGRPHTVCLIFRISCNLTCSFCCHIFFINNLASVVVTT